MADWAKSTSVRTWNTGNSWNYEELLSGAGTLRMRIRIHSDFYDNQSSGIIEIWDSQWKEISHRAGIELTSRHGSPSTYHGPVSAGYRDLSAEALAAFKADRDALLADAHSILR